MSSIDICYAEFGYASRRRSNAGERDASEKRLFELNQHAPEGLQLEDINSIIVCLKTDQTLNVSSEYPCA
eukprot:767191-Hanusia_phi.AAC.2